MDREIVVKSLWHEKEELDERIDRLEKEREDVNEKIVELMKEEKKVVN